MGSLAGWQSFVNNPIAEGGRESEAGVDTSTHSLEAGAEFLRKNAVALLVMRVTGILYLIRFPSAARMESIVHAPEDGRTIQLR
jgi:hypothetical protein